MKESAWCRLVIDRVAKYGPLTLGIDPCLPDMPDYFRQMPGDHWIGPYTNFLLETCAGRVGFVKFQTAYFEAQGLVGLKALAEGIGKAKALGMAVIVDAKRGDIGATAAAYAKAYLTPARAGGSGDFEADCLTLNPLLGPETLEPFLECVDLYGKGVFVLCRTSNPGAGWLQDQIIDGKSVCARMAGLIDELGQRYSHIEGLSPIGAVVGATVPGLGQALRRCLKNAVILAPGVGAQGADVASLNALRGAHRADLLIPVSRGLTQPIKTDIEIEKYRELILKRIESFSNYF